MRTKFVIKFMLVMVAALYAIPAFAVMRPPIGRFEAPTAVPAQIHGLSYIAGLPSIDNKKFPGDYRPKVWADFSKKDFSLMRQRIDQRTLQKKARKLEQIDLVRIPYKKIIDVWYGDDALKKLAVTKLPTLPRNVWNFRSVSYEPLEIYLDQRYRAPVVVIYKESRKRKGAVVLSGPNDKSAAVAALLIRQVKGRKKK